MSATTPEDVEAQIKTALDLDPPLEAEKRPRGRPKKQPPVEPATPPPPPEPEPKPKPAARKRGRPKKTANAADDPAVLLTGLVVNLTMLAIKVLGREVTQQQMEQIGGLCNAVGSSGAAVLAKYDMDVGPEYVLAGSALMLGGAVWALPKAKPGA